MQYDIMKETIYPNDFWRGISSKDFITENGHLMATAFAFDKDIREDGYRELSINWEDDDNALTSLLNQRKPENKKLQFKAGACKISLIDMKVSLRTYLNKDEFSYERREIEGNSYHGNLLIKGSLSKQERSIISTGLALLGDANIVSQTNTDL